MADKFRAWVMVEPGKVEMRDFTMPDIPDDGALLKVEACGICGTDKHAYLEQTPNAPFPFIPGHEFIGTIEKLGSKASEKMAVFGGPVKEGDRVSVAGSSLPCGHCYFCLTMPHRPTLCINRVIYGLASLKRVPTIFGGYSEYIPLHADTYIFKLPEGMPLRRAVLIEPLSNGIRAVERAYSPGEPYMGHGYGIGRSAMVLGTGPVGLMAVAALRYSGAGLIIAQDIFDSKLDMARQMGADVTINGNRPFEERQKQVRKMTDGYGPDVVIEAAGVPVAFMEAVELVRPGGKVIEIGNFSDTGTVAIHPSTVCVKDIDIHGCMAYPAVTFRDAISLLEHSPLPIEEVTTHVLPLEELPRGLDLAGSDGVGKVAIAP